MTDRIKQMAEEAGIRMISIWGEHGGGMVTGNLSEQILRRFAQLVAEDCAKVCEDNFSSGALDVADAIRARYGIKG